MILTILGNNGPYPAPGRACSGYLIESDSGNTRVLMDCGPGVLSRLMEVAPPDTLSAVLLSHLHYDHMSDMLPMQYALQFRPRTSPLPVYLPESPKPVRDLLNVPCYELRAPEDAAIGEMRVSFTPARHPVQTNAIAIKCDGARLAFTGDSNTDEGVMGLCVGADLLLADCGLSSEDYSERAPHYSAALCGELALETGAGRLLLTHLNPKYDPDSLLREARSRFPSAELAVPGMRYRV